MRVQIDSLPEGDWFCETCQIKQRQGGLKLLERVIAPSKSLGRSTSINNRPKPVSMHNNARSRLTERLNNKKPRMTPVRKSPSKAPIVQTPVKRLTSDSLMSPVSRKLPTESSTWGASSTSPPSTLPVSTPSAKPSLTRENTCKVKFLAPSAVANFSSGARANAAKSATACAQPLKAGSVTPDVLLVIHYIPDTDLMFFSNKCKFKSSLDVLLIMNDVNFFFADKFYVYYLQLQQDKLATRAADLHH